MVNPKRQLNPREYRPLAKGKTGARCERTRKRIKAAFSGVFVGESLSSDKPILTIHYTNMPAVASEETYTKDEVIKLDEGLMLLSREKLCRENPMSARGMKEGLRAI